ncbi:uncharacterized protein LOC119580889 [Penaeus monodon]|uniref:uncharacterized protein LOC119580889 n=1 Tax=Penaeus monodon TaxID=6687 RepID=UPI0018A7DBB9|nr:uncharacterized protein LOC119580889 [Penaeus monodon]XP_037785045.1 uncharacterized protein LOC119580889 [Penaeus monodon]
MARGRGLLRGLAGPLALLLLLQLGALAEGRIYYRRRMGMVENFRESALEVCVKPFNPRTRVDLKLKVVNLGSARDVTVGGVSLRKNQLSEGTEHIISASHFVEEGEHKMKVLVDGNDTPYEKAQVYAPSDDYIFYEFTIWLRGRANITQCNVTPKTTTTTTTTSTTTTTTPRPAPTKMTPPPRTERPTANETNLFRKINGNETPRQFTEVTDDDDLTFDELSEEDLPSVEAGTESTIHTNETSKKEEWWAFVWVMGDFKGIPVLLLLIVTFIVGLGLGALCTLCCEVYFSKRRDVDKGHEVDRKFSNYTSFRTDYYPRLSTTTTLTSTLNNARVDNEANHNNPMSQCPPPSPPCSSPPDTYSMPHDAHRERAGSMSVHDETLPLNYPLTYPDRDPQNSKLLHTFGGQSYRESEYQ